MLSSAAVVVPILIEALQPRSVVDVGCGTGAWLAAFQSHGIEDVLGFDGDYVARTDLKVNTDRFRAIDLNERVRHERRFDMAVSLEVAEHLPPERSATFVEDLVALAPAVCFSAAIPLQGGTGHINERWQDEWAELVGRLNYRAVDLIRTRVWDDDRVEPWYAQNTLVYVSDEISIEGDTLPLRLVHPRRYVERMENPTPGDFVRHGLGLARRGSRRLKRRRQAV